MGLGGRVEVELGGLDRGEDRAGVLGETPTLGVSRDRRPAGSTRAAPTSRASAAICCETTDVLVPSTSATTRIEPWRANSTR